MDHVAKMTENK